MNYLSEELLELFGMCTVWWTQFSTVMKLMGKIAENLYLNNGFSETDMLPVLLRCDDRISFAAI